MTDPRTVMLARLAGLDRALELFPKDVASAIGSAADGRQALGADLAPTVEPYPPIRPVAGA